MKVLLPFVENKKNRADLCSKVNWMNCSFVTFNTHVVSKVEFLVCLVSTRLVRSISSEVNLTDKALILLSRFCFLVVPGMR